VIKSSSEWRSIIHLLQLGVNAAIYQLTARHRTEEPGRHAKKAAARCLRSRRRLVSTGNVAPVTAPDLRSSHRLRRP
jgi:hypothetical protein